VEIFVGMVNVFVDVLYFVSDIFSQVFRILVEIFVEMVHVFVDVLYFVLDILS